MPPAAVAAGFLSSLSALAIASEMSRSEAWGITSSRRADSWISTVFVRACVFPRGAAGAVILGGGGQKKSGSLCVSRSLCVSLVDLNVSGDVPIYVSFTLVLSVRLALILILILILLFFSPALSDALALALTLSNGTGYVTCRGSGHADLPPRLCSGPESRVGRLHTYIE